MVVRVGFVLRGISPLGPGERTGKSHAQPPRVAIMAAKRTLWMVASLILVAFSMFARCRVAVLRIQLVAFEFHERDKQRVDCGGGRVCRRGSSRKGVPVGEDVQPGVWGDSRSLRSSWRLV